MAEAGRSTRTIGAALDGVGLGPDGSVWGGELLACSAEGFERLGTLKRSRSRAATVGSGMLAHGRSAPAFDRL